MQKNILFYQANFDPEINRLLAALEKKDEKYTQIFKDKSLKIVQEILNLSIKNAEKEEWSTIFNLITDIDFTNAEERRILSTYGVPFSNKFMSQNILSL